jgi:hypothetical protein
MTVPRTDQKHPVDGKGASKAIPSPEIRPGETAGAIDLLGSPPSAEKRPAFKSDIFATPLAPTKTPRGMPVRGSPSSPADWTEYARNGSASPFGKVAKVAKLSLDVLDVTPRASKTVGLKLSSGNLYNTQDYGRKDVARDRPSSSGSEADSSGLNSQHDESSGVSPVDGDSSFMAGSETGAASSSKRPSVASRPARLMGDPAEMTDEQKAAILLDDFE